MKRESHARFCESGGVKFLSATHPQAHEEDAERAVSAGLALLNTVAKLDTSGGTRLRVRVGIATGLVVVGDLIGEGTA